MEKWISFLARRYALQNKAIISASLLCSKRRIDYCIVGEISGYLLLLFSTYLQTIYFLLAAMALWKRLLQYGDKIVATMTQ